MVFSSFQDIIYLLSDGIYRSISIETDVLPLSHGSSRVIAGLDETDILASVKVEIATPSPHTPNQGLFTVHCGPIDNGDNQRAIKAVRIDLDMTANIIQKFVRCHFSLLCFMLFVFCFLLYVSYFLLCCVCHVVYTRVLFFKPLVSLYL